MTIAQAENFYEQDTKDYEIENNKDFLNWLKNSILDGYHCYIKTEELQELIDNIVKWYEFKYPERELEYFEGIKYMNFQDIKRISNVMDIRQLLFRLPHKQLSIMECGYRAKGWSQRPVYKNGKETGWKAQIYIRIKRKNEEECDPWFSKAPYFFVHADYMTGKVSKDDELEEYLDSKEDLNLDKLLSIFKQKYTDELDFTELKESVHNHNYDIELRHRILQLVALKLLYSRNTVPERGYERAKRFINEFNKKLNLSLSTEQIDEIIHRNYTNGKKWEHILDKDGEEQSCWTVEDVTKKEQSKGIKKLAKIIFNKNRK